MDKEKRGGRKTRRMKAGRKSSDDSDSTDDNILSRPQQQKIEDDRQLIDAGIPIEGMGDEEKQQILKVLRESMTAPDEPIPSTSREINRTPDNSDKTEDSREAVELPEDPLLPQAQEMPSMQYDSDREVEQECDSTTAAPSPPPTHFPTVTIRKKMDFSLKKRFTQQPLPSDAGEGDSDADISDGSDSNMSGKEVPVKLTEEQTQHMKLTPRQKEQGQNRLKDLFNKMTKTLSQQDSSCQSSSEQSPVKTENGDGEMAKSVSAQASQDLFMLHRSDEDSQPLSDVTVPDPIQCDKLDDSDNDNDTVSKPVALDIASAAECFKRKSPSPSMSPSSSQERRMSPGKEGEEQGIGEQEQQYMDDAETVPPDDYVLLSDEEGDEEGNEKEEDEGKRKEEEGKEEKTKKENGRDIEKDLDATQEHDDYHHSPVYPMQVTQNSDNSLPSLGNNSDDLKKITPSKLKEEDVEDRRPLSHDNWFSWPPVSPVCCLKRTYRMCSRKRRELSSEAVPYFCPKTKDAGAYSEVILRMFDTYLQHFTENQRCLHTLLPWGKPVRTGPHKRNTIDLKKRGEPSFSFDFNDDSNSDMDLGTEQPARKKQLIQRHRRKENDADEDRDSDDFESDKQLHKTQSMPKKKFREKKNSDSNDDDFENGQPPLRKRSIRKCRFKQSINAEVDRDINSRTKDVRNHDDKPDLLPSSEDGGDTGLAYDAETQPLDSDSDLLIEPDDTVTYKKPASMGKPQSSPSHLPCSGESQGSNSLLNEQGEFYSTQLPHRKRAGQNGHDMETALKRPRRMAQPVVFKNEDQDSPVKLRPLSRKRKQDNRDPIFKDVYDLDNDDDEVSFPRKQKIEMRVNKSGFVHISSSRTEKRGVKSAVVHPLPRTDCVSETMSELKPTGSSRGHPGSPDPSGVSSSVDVRGAETADVRGVDVKDVNIRNVRTEDRNESVQATSTSRPDQSPVINDSQQSQQSGECAAADVEVYNAFNNAGDDEDNVDDNVAEDGNNDAIVSSAQDQESEDSDSGLTTCPICNQQFSNTKILVQHASDCNGMVDPVPEEPEDDPLPAVDQLQRRPLRSFLQREKFVCSVCTMTFSGSVTLKQHYDKCRQQLGGEEETSSSTDDFASNRPSSSTATTTTRSTRSLNTSCKSTHKDVFKSDGCSGFKRAPAKVQSSAVEGSRDVRETDSDDSSDGPHFIVIEDDKTERNKKNGKQKETEQASTSNFIPISKLKDTPLDFQNQFSRRQRKRHTNSAVDKD